MVPSRRVFVFSVFLGWVPPAKWRCWGNAQCAMRVGAGCRVPSWPGCAAQAWRPWIPPLHRPRARAPGRRPNPLRVRGGGTRIFTARAPGGASCSIPARSPASWPTGRAGWSSPARRHAVGRLEALLAAHGQCLPFEPPHSPAACCGGMVAAGPVGPGARQHRAPMRDYRAGRGLINGRAELLRFGGQVMKNVWRAATFRVSRPAAGGGSGC